MSETVNALDLDEIADRWLRLCGSHDARMSMSCTCPEGDPRNVIDGLVTEVVRLRAEVERRDTNTRTFRQYAVQVPDEASPRGFTLIRRLAQQILEDLRGRHPGAYLVTRVHTEHNEPWQPAAATPPEETPERRSDG